MKIKKVTNMFNQTALRPKANIFAQVVRSPRFTHKVEKNAKKEQAKTQCRGNRVNIT